MPLNNLRVRYFHLTFRHAPTARHALPYSLELLRNNNNSYYKMNDANLFAGIDLMELIPLIAIGVVESASKQANIPVASTPRVLSGSDFLRSCEHQSAFMGQIII